MIFFGSKEKAGRLAPMPGARCSSCGNDSLSVATTFKYFHIYWIPFFPYRRSLVTSCSHCKAQRTSSEAANDPALNNALLQAKKAPFPLHMFSGLLVVAGFSLIVTFNAQRDAHRRQSQLAAPMVGDFYLVKLRAPIHQDQATLNYAVFRVAALNDKTLELDRSAWAYSKAVNAGNAIRNGELVVKEFDPNGRVSVTQASLNDGSALDGTIEFVIRLEPPK